MNESRKNLLTVNEAADFLSITKRSLYSLMNKRKIKYYKSAGGKLAYFDVKVLEEWMKAKTIDII